MQLFAQQKQHTGSRAIANNLPGKQHNSRRSVVQFVVPKGLMPGTRVVSNTGDTSGKKGIIVREFGNGYMVRIVDGPRLLMKHIWLDLDENTSLVALTPEITGPNGGNPMPLIHLPQQGMGSQTTSLLPPVMDPFSQTGFQSNKSISIGERPMIAPPESGEHFRWPEALWENVIRTLPTEVVINNAKTLYKYGPKGGVSIQPPEGREMKKQQGLVERGAWKNEQTRRNYVLTVEGGILKDVNGVALNGSIQYVLSEDWKLYGQEVNALNKEKEIYGRSSDVHTRYLAGGPARSAGWIKTEGGKITRVGNDSGHYGPNKYMLYQLLTLLKDGGTDLSAVKFHDAVVDKASNALEMYNWMKSGAVGKEPKNENSTSM